MKLPFALTAWAVLSIVAFALMAIGQSGRVATLSGNALSVAAVSVFIVGANQIIRRTRRS